MNKNHKPILGDYRNNWYNEDYLELLSRRFELSRMKDILDVGCGKFHWTSLLFDYFADNAVVSGVDIVPLNHEEIVSLEGERFNFYEGSSDELPFEDESFDLVTCQTLLIHLKAPLLTLAEMYRVLRKGGMILISEPNNLAQTVFRNSANTSDGIESRIHRVKEKMKSETAKIKNGHGDNSIGELVPGLLEDAGFRNVNCFINDKINIMKPPYESSQEQSKIKMLKNLIDNYPFQFSESEKEEINNVLGLIKKQKYTAYNPTMLFLSTGIK